MLALVAPSSRRLPERDKVNFQHGRRDITRLLSERRQAGGLPLSKTAMINSANALLMQLRITRAAHIRVSLWAHRIIWSVAQACCRSRFTVGHSEDRNSLGHRRCVRQHAEVSKRRNSRSDWMRLEIGETDDRFRIALAKLAVKECESICRFPFVSRPSLRVE